MKQFKYLLILLFVVFSCEKHQEISKLQIQWRPGNHLNEDNSYFLSKLTLINNSDESLRNNGWTIYFNSPNRILKNGEKEQDFLKQGIDISLTKGQSGNYYALKPQDSFSPLLPGEKRDFLIHMSNRIVLKTDAPSGFHISHDGKTADAILAKVIIEPTDSHPRNNTLKAATPASRFADNTKLLELDLADKIIPRPYSVTETGTPLRIELSDIKIVAHENLINEVNFLNQFFKTMTGKFPSEEHTRVYLKIDSHLDIDNDEKADAESYIFYTKPDSGIVIIGKDKAGIFYGIQTLRQLISYDFYKKSAEKKYLNYIDIPQVKITDKPRFAYRGMMLDVASHFQSKETVMKLLDLLAFFKINKFHFHLNGDEAWRLDIPEIPELTEFGSKRGFDVNEEKMQHMIYGTGDNVNKPKDDTEANFGIKPQYNGYEDALSNFVGSGSGYYTTKDFEDILHYAAERHIDVIPEVTMPAHCRAAILSMEYRYQKYINIDMEKATQYRLIDPADNSRHKTVLNYDDNFINPGLPSTYAFLTTVVRSIKKRYDAVPEATLNAIHGGGDKLPNLNTNVWWQHSPVVKRNPATRNFSDKELISYFAQEWQKIINSAGAEMIGWWRLFENADSTLQLDGYVPLIQNAKNKDSDYKLANKGYQTILADAASLNLNLAYNCDLNEVGKYEQNFVDTKTIFNYQFCDTSTAKTSEKASGIKSETPKNIIGIQAALWGENLKVPELIEYLTFPKLIAFAERSWTMHISSEENLNTDWQLFANALGQSVLPILDFYQPIDIRNEVPDKIGVKYRVPLPGTKLEKGILRTNIRFPGLTVEYTKNNGKFWRTWSKPAKLAPPVKIRTKTKRDRYSRIVEIVE